MKTEIQSFPVQDTVANPLVFYRDIKPLSADTTLTLQSTSKAEPPPPARFFTAWNSHAISVSPRLAERYQPDWILGILILCLMLIAWSNFFYHKRLRQIFLSPYSKRFLNQLVRDGNLFAERITLALILVYLFSVSLLIYLAFNLMVTVSLPFTAPPYLVFGFILIVLIGYWLIKILMIRVVGTTFRTESTTREYLLNVLIFNIITGVTLLPFLIPTVYLKSPFFLYIGFFIVGLFLIFRFFRGFLIGISLRKFSYLFLIVYLCALEILPLLILLKLILINTESLKPVR